MRQLPAPYGQKQNATGNRMVLGSNNCQVTNLPGWLQGDVGRAAVTQLTFCHPNPTTMKPAHNKKGQSKGSTRIIGGSSHGRAADNSTEFHALFSAQFLQRYADLFQALAAPVQHVALLNSFTTVNDIDEVGLTERICQAGPISCYRFSEQRSTYPPPPSCPYTQLKQWFWLDLASVLPPLLLGVQPHHVVLDMCAAPGGKSLVLAMQLLLGQAPETAAAAAAGGGGGDDGGGEGGGEGPQGGLTAAMLQQLHMQGPEGTVEAEGAQQQLDSHHHGGQQLQQEQHSGPQAAATAAGAAAPPLPNENGAVGSGQPGSASPEAAAASAQEQQQQQQDGEQQDNQQDNQQEQGQQQEEEEEEEEDWPPAVTSSSSSAGRLVCNELDPVRRGRLSGVLASYIPGSSRRRVRVMGHDAAKHWARFEAGLYDRVLLDAPCSSERHVVQAALEAGGVVSSSSWSRTHCNNLAALQLKLLLAGLRALKPGGRLVYSTCSMAACENDAVVQQALRMQQQQQGSGASLCSVVPVQEWGLASSLVELAGADMTECGVLILPDKAGWGPIYMCLLQKE